MDIQDEEQRRAYWNNRLLKCQESWRDPIASRCDVKHILHTETEWLRQELIRLDMRLREYRYMEHEHMDRIARLSMGDVHASVYSNGHPVNGRHDPRAVLRVNERIMRNDQMITKQDDMMLQEQTLMISSSFGTSDEYAT
jgi:hypothetical protein